MSFDKTATTMVDDQLASRGAWSRVPSVACLDRRVSAGDWRVLTLLCKFADKNGRCFPSQQRLATILGMRRQVVGRHLKRLDEWGYITRKILHRGKRGQWGFACYWIQYPLFKA